VAISNGLSEKQKKKHWKHWRWGSYSVQQKEIRTKVITRNRKVEETNTRKEETSEGTPTKDAFRQSFKAGGRNTCSRNTKNKTV
jgi:hypothetical protein